MNLTLTQRKMLGRLEQRAIAEDEPHFEDAKPIFEQLARKGLAERVEDDFGAFVWQKIDA